MTRKIIETEHLYVYNDNDSEIQIAFKVQQDTVTCNITTDNSSQTYEMKSACDLCGKHSKLYYVCPELPNHGICYACFTQHKKNVKWYQEDMHVIFNQILSNVLFNDLLKDITQEELDLIDNYFEAHSNHPLKIREFIKKYGKGSD